MKGKLYLVATPIGNLGDITLRALETLKTVDVIACEDTRHTLGLLTKFEIKKPLISYYKQKEKEGTQEIAGLLDEGKNVALVTDAGMPCISDPGSVLIQYLMENGYEYTVVPGACAAVSAVALTGIVGEFTFIGFLPEKQSKITALLSPYKTLPSHLIFYAAPHDVNRILDTLYKELGERKVYITKEITKIYENVTVGNLKDTRAENPKGEYVIIVGLPPVDDTPMTDEEIKELLKEAILSGADKKQAIKELSVKYGLSKNIVYKLSLEL